jgi:hypothetical protein
MPRGYFPGRRVRDAVSAATWSKLLGQLPAELHPIFSGGSGHMPVEK